MKLGHAALLFVSLAAGPGGADAQDYVRVSVNEEVVASVLPSSVRRDQADSDLVWADVRFASRAKLFLPSTQQGNSYKSIDMRALVNCAEANNAMEIETVFRSRNGSVVERHTHDRATAPRFAVSPGSVNSMWISWVCNRVAPKAAALATAAASASPQTEVAASESKRPKERDRKSMSSGTAFIVSRDGHALTNNHVVRACDGVTLTSTEGTEVAGRIIVRDERNDLALIGTSAVVSSVATFRRTSLRSGEDVVALGFPYRGLLAADVNVSVGIVSAMAGLLNDTSQLQISAPVQPGNSGGPLLDALGAVAGVVVAKLDALVVAKVTGDIPQNINFAIKGEVAQSFLRSHGIEPSIGPDKGTKPSVADSVQAARKYTFLVECEAKR